MDPEVKIVLEYFKGIVDFIQFSNRDISEEEKSIIVG